MAAVWTQPRTYLAEIYVSRRAPQVVDAAVEQLHAAAEARTRSGEPIRHLQAVFLPADETCLHLFEAHSLAAVEQVLRDADIEAERIGEVVSVVSGAGAVADLKGN
jgi:hypothetical protein